MPHLSFVAADLMNSPQGNKAFNRLIRITCDFLRLAKQPTYLKTG
jgi:hypothetical protein